MSTKNTKININIPKYDIEGQMQFLSSLCDDLHFDCRTLITLILADWICKFQVATSTSDFRKSFISFLSKADNIRKQLEEIKKYVEKNDTSCEH